MRLCFLLTVLVLLSFLLPVAAENVIPPDEFEAPVVRGDANADGKLNTADYVLVKRHVLRTKDLSEKGFKAADVNGDGRISAVDYVLIKRVVMGTAEFPCIHSYTEEIVGNMHVFTCTNCGHQYKKFDGQLIG